MTQRIEVSMDETQIQFPQLIGRAKQGDTVVIVGEGELDLYLMRSAEVLQARKPGSQKGKIRISANFDAISEEIVGGFEGSR